MNWQHLQTFAWLRWRLMANQWRRAGRINAIISTAAMVAAVVMAVPLFCVCFGVALYTFPKASPVHLLYVWDGVIVAFVFCWSIGLLSDLQRSDSLSLTKFLHLPVSANSAFLINYVSSLLCLTLIIFVPVMFGLGLGLVFAKGVGLLAVLPLSAAFLLMVTALTYQFQGWLASLMSNPRRRRTVVVAATAIFILIFQLPNLLNVYRPWGKQQRNRNTALIAQLQELDRAFKAQKLDGQEYARRSQELVRKDKLAREQDHRQSSERWEHRARLANLILPVGWLPLGVASAAEGSAAFVILGLTGMTLIGTASLWRAYRTTIRLYQGQFTAGKRRSAPATAAQPRAAKSGTRLLEARLPGFSEPVSAIALAGLRSLLRSPEAKMMLLMPVVLIVVFGAMVLRAPPTVPDLVRPLIAVGLLGMVMFCMLQLMCNQFGFDRDGFRVFVLSAAPRADILLGKNLAFSPLAALIAGIMLVLLQAVRPLRLDHFVAMLPQFVSMYLLFCILTNLISIEAPFQVPAGSLKPANPKLVPILMQMVMVMCLFPLMQVSTLLPLGIEAALEWLGWARGAPVLLVLSLAQCAIVVAIYHYALKWQGRLLAAREQKILECVTGRAA